MRFASSTTVCRAAAGTCDVAEKCTGASGSCPADGSRRRRRSVARRRAPATWPRHCTGSSASCPADALVSTTVCRPRRAPATSRRTARGLGVMSGGRAPRRGTVCRASAGSCDVPESCSGSSGSCPADSFLPSSTVCRAQDGVCDVAENCTGSRPHVRPTALPPATMLGRVLQRGQLRLTSATSCNGRAPVARRRIPRWRAPTTAAIRPCRLRLDGRDPLRFQGRYSSAPWRLRAEGMSCSTGPRSRGAASSCGWRWRRRARRTSTSRA